MLLEGLVQPSGNQVRVNAQLIDADSGAHIWADQFDTARAELLQMQDEIVTRLARATYLQLTEAEAARLKRIPAANADAEDLALQCSAAILKFVTVRAEAEAGFRLCEQALALDPNNVRALTYLAIKFVPERGVRGAVSKDNLERADALLSKALTLDPNYGDAHEVKATLREFQLRPDEAVAEHQRAIALNPSDVEAYARLGFVYRRVGQFEAGLEFIEKAIRLSPHDPNQPVWYLDRAGAHLALKQYDQAVEWARRSIAIQPGWTYLHVYLIVALALTGRESQAHEALQRYLALPNNAFRTLAEFRLERAKYLGEHGDPRNAEYWDREMEGLRRAGMPEQ